ncbi:hypothetical protein QFZ99_006109 [Paraburkholderia atlantica]|uniref:hypothetical protein n=1 Tax=Paraburkholderia atlantica TaxID=2654982 RepID=UPI003D252D36
MSSNHDIQGLDKRIKEIQGSLVQLGEQEFEPALTKIIFRNGFTTPAEWKFIEALLTSIERQVATVRDQCTQLVSAAEMVNQKE